MPLPAHLAEKYQRQREDHDAWLAAQYRSEQFMQRELAKRAGWFPGRMVAIDAPVSRELVAEIAAERGL